MVTIKNELSLRKKPYAECYSACSLSEYNQRIRRSEPVSVDRRSAGTLPALIRINSRVLSTTDS